MLVCNCVCFVNGCECTDLYNNFFFWLSSDERSLTDGVQWMEMADWDLFGGSQWLGFVGYGFHGKN